MLGLSKQQAKGPATSPQIVGSRTPLKPLDGNCLPKTPEAFLNSMEKVGTQN